MNAKSERVIRTLMEMWHNQQIFKDSKDRQQNLSDLLTIIIRLNCIKRFLGKHLMSF
jgi:hypothetical protein